MKKRNFILVTLFGVVLFIFDLPKRLGPINYIENNDAYNKNKEFGRENTSYMEQFYKINEEEQNWAGKIWLMLKSPFTGKSYYKY